MEQKSEFKLGHHMCVGKETKCSIVLSSHHSSIVSTAAWVSPLCWQRKHNLVYFLSKNGYWKTVITNRGVIIRQGIYSRLSRSNTARGSCTCLVTVGTTKV